MAKIPERRKLVAGFAAALALGQVPLFAAEHGDPKLSALRSALWEAYGGLNLRTELAHACISHCPDIALSRTTTELVESFARMHASGSKFRDWLHEQTTADFIAGHVVRVQGWVISETEFLLFARLAT